jgi:hypothetical protein
MDDVGQVFSALGGFDSKYRYSVTELKAMTAKHAKHAETCLFLLDVMLKLSGPDKMITPTAAKSKLVAWFDETAPAPIRANRSTSRTKARSDFNDPFKKLLEPDTQLSNLHSKSVPNYEKQWAEYKHGFEFIAALFSMRAGNHWEPLQAQKSGTPPPYTSALRYIIDRKIYLLPLADPKFQTELLGRAKYFSHYMERRKNIAGLKARFADVREISAQLEILSADGTKVFQSLQKYAET